jgi:hypothetical protein
VHRVQKGNTVYGYDPMGNLTNINYPVSADVILQYDGLNRLTGMELWFRNESVCSGNHSLVL